jgi:3-dehydroquinate dehydratase
LICVSLREPDCPSLLEALGLGPVGTFTRVVATRLGAPFTYASLRPGRDTAEGQLDWRTLQDRMRALGD